jgi:hypothetical protein
VVSRAVKLSVFQIFTTFEVKLSVVQNADMNSAASEPR